MESKTNFHNTILGDGGFRSRKFVAFLASSVLVFLGYLIAGRWPTFFGPFYSEFGGLVVGLFVAYLGGNWAGKWTLAKNIPDSTKDATT
jgi:membrane protein DedA with SNARE-associated domain